MEVVEGHAHQVPLGPALVVVDVDSTQQLSPVDVQLTLPLPCPQVWSSQHNPQVLPHSTVCVSKRVRITPPFPSINSKYEAMLKEETVHTYVHE